MARYGQTFKDRAVARLLPPESAALKLVASEVGVGTGTLQRWRDDVQSMPARGRAWTASARLQAVITTAAMPEAGKSAWCHEQGIYPGELEKWCASAAAALNDPQDARASLQRLKVNCWPYAGAVGLVERFESEVQIHVINNWCYLGSVSTVSQAHQLDVQAEGFDADGYRILCRPVLSGSAEIVAL